MSGVLDRAVLIRSSRIALIVGTLLTIINQWEALAGEATISLVKVGLTYLVPFCVATYSAVLLKRDMARTQDKHD